MSTLTEGPASQTSEKLAEELHELEAQEAALERRTRSLELAGPLAMIFSFIALAFGIGALAIALTHNTDKRVVTMMRAATPAPSGSSAGSSSMSGGMNSTSAGMSSTASTGTIPGANGRGKFTSEQVAAAKRGAIYVQLGDIWADPTVASVPAGKITFHAYNVGKLSHELMVERAPLKFDGPGKPNEDSAQAMIPVLTGGGHGRVTARLKPGKYVLFCNVEGHYAAGQHVPFTVTKA